MKVLKKMMSICFASCILLSLSVPAFAFEGNPGTTDGANRTSIYTNSETGITIITTEGPTIELTPVTPFANNIDPRIGTDKQISRTYTYDVRGPETGNLLGTVEAKVTAIYSSADRTCQILDIEIVRNTGSRLGTSKSISGSKGTLYIYYDGMSISAAEYQIYTTGVLTETKLY